MRRAAGWEQEFFEVESFRVTTDEMPNGVVHDRGDGEGPRRRRAGRSRTAEGNGPVNALDQALRLAIALALPGARARPPHRLQGARARHRQGHRRRHAGADRLDRTASAAGPRSASPRTSSRRRGRRSSTRSCTACCTLANRKTEAMAAPEYVPVKSTDRARAYESPDYVPGPWLADRPGDLVGPAARGTACSATPAPTRATRSCSPGGSHDRLQLADREHAEDAVAGCVAVATRRASLFGGRR